MNNKIFALLTKNLHKSFNLVKYQNLMFDKDTQVDALPWTPARYRKFKDAIFSEIDLTSDYVGPLSTIVNDLDLRYSQRFFGKIWKPRIDSYTYTGWALADEISRQNPINVLDVGCGYHLFKDRIPNIIGIDPYNNCADYQVDILEYKVPAQSYDHIIALGSINFNGKEDIIARFAHCVNLLMPLGKFYLRANPGISHKLGMYVDIFPWTFEIVRKFADKFNLHLDTFKKEENGRLYFVYTKQ